jgi:hypothetical protein
MLLSRKLIHPQSFAISACLVEPTEMSYRLEAEQFWQGWYVGTRKSGCTARWVICRL